MVVACLKSALLLDKAMVLVAEVFFHIFAGLSLTRSHFMSACLSVYPPGSVDMSYIPDDVLVLLPHTFFVVRCETVLLHNQKQKNHSKVFTGELSLVKYHISTARVNILVTDKEESFGTAN